MARDKADQNQNINGSLSMTLHRIRITQRFAVTLALPIVIGGTLPLHAQDTPIVVGAPAPVAALWPVFVAQTNGTFEEAGLDVTTRYVGGGQGLQQLVSNDLQIFVTNPDQPALAQDRGAPVQGFIGMINTPFSLLGAPGVTSFDDLQGKRIGTAAIASSDATLISTMLLENGLAKSEFEVFQTGSGSNKIAALLSGNVSAVTLTQPQDFIYLNSETTAVRLALSSDVVDSQAIAAFYNSNWADDNPEAVDAFVEAVREGKSFLLDEANRDAAIESLASSANVAPEIAAEIYDFYLEESLFETALELDLDMLDTYLDMAREAGIGDFETASNYFVTTWSDAEE
ncbi:ABC transporter substrate-binding protein [Roseicyclus sp. F158]|uniref:ABC transporter substrate-binding protein n=1 Tax=Tropicimonas omnivorans TaxID=3075590 RepID=A0ABU3DE72_9RHOB|nr:ABC transporter substrate-binding protein [Roseicyclus sp. F158]MDT0682016.1 ABC transporter substrate-binding protein [Roseicyclus sp. F158]